MTQTIPLEALDEFLEETTDGPIYVVDSPLLSLILTAKPAGVNNESVVLNLVCEAKNKTITSHGAMLDSENVINSPMIQTFIIFSELQKILKF